MCGIAGFVLAAPGLEAPELERQAARMAARLRHRGPDGQGTWVDAGAGVALGHTRLAVLDPSPAGHQPMVGERYVLVYNGEIYNYQELQPGARGDTEVLLAALERWGVEGTLPRLNGMFAFAVWDRENRELVLARDRLGKKPLYYGWWGDRFCFASELKALPAGTVDPEAVELFLRYGYIPAPRSIYREFRKLPPGHVLRGRRAQAWWRPEDALRQPVEGDLESLLRDSIRLRLRSDVPLGVFLSGGVDSAVVAALAGVPLRTFTIGFREAPYDEAPRAEAVARFLGTEHETLYVTPAEAQAVLPSLPEIYDEPFADSSQIPTVLLSRLARREVTVALAGDGGDELFFGYARYFHALRAWRWLRRVPAGLRRRVARLLAALPLPHRHWRLLVRWLASADFAQLYESLIPPGESSGHPPDLQMRLNDLEVYLPDDLLVKVDRASMAVGLEVRCPLLDHRLVAWALQAPRETLASGRVGKLPLRRLLPPELRSGPKQGFAVPVGEWLRGPLRGWAEDLMASAEPRFRRLWERHRDGLEEQPYAVWHALSLEAWSCRWKESHGNHW